MTRFFSRLFGTKTNQITKARKHAFWPQIEALEKRDLMAGSISLTAGVITIVGTASADSVIVQLNNRGTASGLDDRIVVHFTHDTHSHSQSFNLWNSAADGTTANVHKIIFRGGEGNDSFVNYSIVNAEAYGDAGKDSLTGGGGSDKLYGGDGMDVLKGGAGADQLRGEGSHDKLYGGGGSDSIYGGAGNDYLEGGAGDDGLFGGTGTDTARGGTGADRFLSWKNVNNSFGFRHDPDTLSDVNLKDAKINFEDSTSSYDRDGGKFGFDDDIKYAAKSWSSAEIEDIDQAFAVLHERTGDTRLLKTDWGFEMKLLRIGSPNKPDGGIQGTNGGGTIRLMDSAFTGGFDPLMGVVIHEIGHNWEVENPEWEAFKALSGWKQLAFWESKSSYLAASDGWYYLEARDNEFVSEYAKTNPKEDFAESFAAYFLDRAGWTWTRGGEGASTIPGKIDLIDGWLDTI